MITQMYSDQDPVCSCLSDLDPGLVISRGLRYGSESYPTGSVALITDCMTTHLKSNFIRNGKPLFGLSNTNIQIRVNLGANPSNHCWNSLVPTSN